MAIKNDRVIYLSCTLLRLLFTMYMYSMIQCMFYGATVGVSAECDQIRNYNKSIKKISKTLTFELTYKDCLIIEIPHIFKNYFSSFFLISILKIDLLWSPPSTC